MREIFKEHKIGLIKILLSALLLLEATLLSHFDASVMSLACNITSYGIIGYSVIFRAVGSLLKRGRVGEELLMSVASLGAILIGEYFEGVLVLILFTIGEIFEDVAKDKSRRSIKTLASIRPDKARLLDGTVVSAASVEIGQIIEVYAGERIALDGDVVDGIGSIDTSIMTGESEPVEVRCGTEVLAGCLNLSAPLKIRVKRHSRESAAQRIIDLAENALERKTKSEKFISIFAKFYTPIVILLSVVAIIILWALGLDTLSESAYRALSMLAISCPCAIVISVPLSYFCGIAYASKNGILVKGSSVIDALCRVRQIAFDKTGTLTKNELHVTKIETILSLDRTELLKYACIVEQKSTHPLATAVIAEANRLNIVIDDMGENHIEKIGFGVECDSKYGHIKAGNREFVGAPEDAHGNILISLNCKYIGSISLGDEIKPNGRIAFEHLLRLGVENRVIISGDKQSKVKSVSRALGADAYYAELTPEQKLATLESIISEANGNVAYCGDGINDTPSLARADVGISMGALGSDSAVECSDVVIMDDDIEKVAKAIKIAKRTKRTVIANIVISLAVKATMLILASLGAVSMLSAVLSDVGILIFAIILALLAGR